MAEAGSLVQEWRVLDAQYFGVPQRRRRVFLVSVFDTATAARCPDPLLPVSESMQRDTPTSGTPRQEPTRTTPESVASRGEQARLLGSNIVGSLNAVDYKWPQNQQLDENKFVVVGEPMMIDPTRVDDVRVYEPPVQTLQARMGTGGNQVPMLAFDTQFGSNANVFENQSPTLKASQAAPSVAYTLRMREGKPGGGKGPLISEEKSLTLGAATNDQTVFQPTPPTNMAVRRLTPIECERLMGWPDGWTDGQADTHRYKQCGNGVASPVATWIAQQLLQLDKEHHAPPTTTTT